MESKELLEIIKAGETSKVQFKQDFDNQDKIAAEMIAMSNKNGGIIIFGIEDKTGQITGLDYERLQFIGNKISMIATDLIKPQIFITFEVLTFEDFLEDDLAGKKVLLLYIDEGTAKPYKDNNGIIWLKQGCDKRKITDNNEILRLFQQSGTAFVDEMTVAETGINDVDKEKVDIYINKILEDPGEWNNLSIDVLYENLCILKNQKLTLGGLLFFAKNPQRYRYVFCVKAVAFYGNDMGGLHYRDSRDINGTIPVLFQDSLSFFKANLKHEQKGQNFNSVGILEISEIALEELIQNALIHRDYTMNSPVRLFIFDNRIEIISPGCLPNSLNVDKIKFGSAAVRNHLLVNYASKLMKYRGLGTGIIRARKAQPDIEFINDTDGNQFIVRIPRKHENK